MRMVQAFGASVGSVITQTMIRDLYEGSERIQLFSIISGALAFSPAIGPLVGGFVSEWYGWRANFSLLNLLAMGLLLWSWHSLPETRAVHVPQLTWREILKLNRSMVSSAAFWGHVILIGTTNGILFSFYEEAPFVFIEKLGIAPSIYGCLGMLIAGSSLLAAHLSYRLSLQKIAPEATIRRGACCAIAGSALWLAIAAAGELQSGSLGFVAALAGMALLFLGVGLIIPNSLSLALRPFQAIGGTAGSLFGGYYYVLIAFFTWAMGWFHNGSACPLPGYLLALSILALCGSQLARRSATASLCSEPKSVT
jgi:MFS family permease